MSWTAASMVILGLALAGGFAWWERAHPPSRLIALVATLAALAAIGRIAFAPLPNVKPTTDIVLFAGYALGGAPGFAVGAVAALASNFFFGQGPWTPWQMAGWGLVGLGGAALAYATRGRTLGRVPLAIACGVAGLVFGAIMNLSMWVTYSGDHTLAQLGAYSGTSLTFDLAHAIGNVVFCLAFGPALVAALTRFRSRLEVTWVPVGAAAAAAAALALALPLAAPSTAAAAKAPQRSVAYLLEAQNDDGGFGGAPGQASSPLYTGWTALGLAAAGHNPLDVARSGTSIVDNITARVGQLSDLGELARTILVWRAAGLDPRDVGGRDLVAELAGAQRRNGSFAGRVNTTAFAILGLRAAGHRKKAGEIRRAAGWIRRQANRDGGFNFAGRGGMSGIDDSSAAIQALAAAGKRRSKVVRRAVSFVLRSQRPDGGFGLSPGAPSNAQSTAWAMQALVAVRRNPAKVRRRGSRTPPGFLRSLTAPSGAVRYSRTGTQTPVWVTGQVVNALSRKAFPLKPVARSSREPRAAATPEAEATADPEPARTATAAPALAARREASRGAPLRARTRDAAEPARPGLTEAAAGRIAHQAGVVTGVTTAMLL